MDQIIERKLDEQTLKSRFWRFFFVFHAPVYVHCSLYLMLSCVWWMLFPHLWLFWLIIVVFCASYLFTFFSNVWRISRDTFRRQGAFEQQTIVHLTDKYMEISQLLVGVGGTVIAFIGRHCHLLVRVEREKAKGPPPLDTAMDLEKWELIRYYLFR